MGGIFNEQIVILKNNKCFIVTAALFCCCRAKLGRSYRYNHVQQLLAEIVRKKNQGKGLRFCLSDSLQILKNITTRK